MAEVQGFERRLAAVLMLDVAGYSRLMGLDEETTHRRFRDKMRGFIGRSIAAAGGRIVKGSRSSTGSGFGSASATATLSSMRATSMVTA